MADVKKKARVLEPEDKPKDPSAPFFLLTYSDVVTLLLCLFVLLFAMSSTQEESFKDLAESLQSALGTHSIPRSGTISGIIKPNEIIEKEAEAVLGGEAQKEINEIISDTRDMIISNKFTGEIEVKETPYKVIIRIFDNALFKVGSSKLLPQGLDLMEKIANVLKNFSYRISVEGHTDNVGGESIGNWQLSSLRACSVVNFLVQKGLDPNYLSVKGYGAYASIANNETQEGRARNRRVEIIYNRSDIAKSISKKKYR